MPPVYEDELRSVEYIIVSSNPVKTGGGFQTKTVRNSVDKSNFDKSDLDVFVEAPSLNAGMDRLRLITNRARGGAFYVAVPDPATAASHAKLIRWRRALATSQKFRLPATANDPAVDAQQDNNLASQSGGGRLWKVNRSAFYPVFVGTVRTGHYLA